MLVLSRKVGESLVIDENIIIKIIEVQSGQIRLGIEAPKAVSIYRQEIHNKIHGIVEESSKPRNQIKEIGV